MITLYDAEAAMIATAIAGWLSGLVCGIAISEFYRRRKKS